MKSVESDYLTKGVFISLGGSFVFQNLNTDTWKVISPRYYGLGYTSNSVFIYDYIFFRMG